MTEQQRAILRRRAFDYIDLGVWMARNSHRLEDVHHAYYTYRNMETSLHPTDYIIENWYDGDLDEFFRETEDSFARDIRVVRGCYKIRV